MPQELESTRESRWLLSSGSQPMAFRLTRILAALGFFASLGGIVPAAAVARAASGSALDNRLLWVLVPVLSAAAVFLLARRRSLEPMWALTGTCWGFVVVAAWSLGLFFAPSALLLLIASIAHLVALGPTRRAVLIPAWFLAGASGVCVLFLARDQLLTMSRGQVIEAPAIVTGAWVFAGLVMFLVIATQVASRWLAAGRVGEQGAQRTTSSRAV